MFYAIKYFFLSMLMIIVSCSGFAYPDVMPIDQLRADYRILQQARADLEQSLKKDMQPSSETLDLQNWVRQLGGQMAIHCRELIVLSATIPADIPCDEILKKYPESTKIDTGAEMTRGQKTKKLEDQLNGSLGEFD